MAAVNAAINLAGGDSDDSGAAAMDADSAPAAAPAAAGGGGGAPGPIAASDLAAVLGSILSGAGGAGGGGGGLRQRMADPGPGLGEVLKPELVAPLLRSPEMVARLAPYLPEEHRCGGAGWQGGWGAWPWGPARGGRCREAGVGVLAGWSCVPAAGSPAVR